MRRPAAWEARTMRYRPSKVRTWFILLTGNLVWTFAAWAGGPVVPSDPSRYLRIQRFTTTEIRVAPRPPP